MEKNDCNRSDMEIDGIGELPLLESSMNQDNSIVINNVRSLVELENSQSGEFEKYSELLREQIIKKSVSHEDIVKIYLAEIIKFEKDSKSFEKIMVRNIMFYLLFFFVLIILLFR